MRQEEPLHAGFVRDPPTILRRHMAFPWMFEGKGAIEDREIGMPAQRHQPAAVFGIPRIDAGPPAIFHAVPLTR